MNINFKSLVISIAIPLILGSLIGVITAGANNYQDLVLPAFAPPAITFPIVWSILYTLMGISSYLVYESNSYNNTNALIIYSLQLVLNLLWSIIFFVFRLKILAFLWIILLIVAVIYMIKEFYIANKTAAYLQIPYLLWLIFAAVLNLSIIFLN